MKLEIWLLLVEAFRALGCEIFTLAHPFSTCMMENGHSIGNAFTPKALAFESSWRLRRAIGLILEILGKFAGSRRIYIKLGIPLNYLNEVELQELDDRAAATSARKKTVEHRTRAAASSAASAKAERKRVSLLPPVPLYKGNGKSQIKPTKRGKKLEKLTAKLPDGSLPSADNVTPSLKPTPPKKPRSAPKKTGSAPKKAHASKKRKVDDDDFDLTDGSTSEPEDKNRHRSGSDSNSDAMDVDVEPDDLAAKIQQIGTASRRRRDHPSSDNINL